MKRTLLTIALAALTIGLLGSCKKEDPKGSVTGVTVKAALPEGALSGEFTVNADGRKVHFSQGNLWYGKVGSATTATWNFETNQYDVQSSWDASHVSHFFWSKDASVAYAATYSESGTSGGEVFFTNAEAETAKTDFTVNGVTGKYRTLSTAEWQYLFNTRTVNGGTGKDKSYSLNITYGGKRGLVLYPDNYDKDPISGKVTTELPEGVVFLPAVGYRRGSNVGGVGVFGYYWASAADISNGAYSVFFDNDADPGTIDDRSFGRSVRLIKESN